MSDDSSDPFAAVPAPSPKRDAESGESLGNYSRPLRPPILTPRQIRRLADDRRRLRFALILVGAVYLATFLFFRLRIHDGLSVDPQVFVPALMGAFYLLHIPAAIFAWRVKSPLSPSQPAAFLLSALVCVPVLCLFICLTLFQESRAILERHGIRASLWTVDRTSLPGRDAE